MAGKKAATPAPIDRPLSRAYLREFSGWATANPPGLSDPTSLLEMRNCWITDAGAASVRPAIRSLFADDIFLDSTYGVTAVGTFEPFFLNDGTKALLFAVREIVDSVEIVGFRYAVPNAFGVYTVHQLEEAFTVPQGYSTLAFTAATTYVKYVQIDNKVFALSNSGEELRLFWVGSAKSAKKLTLIPEPAYTDTDRLTVVHPVASWISGPQVTVPAAETPTSTTLISSTAASNIYNFGYFYTFISEIGESAPSKLRIAKTQRGWSQWTPDPTNDSASPDQLVAYMPEDVWDDARAHGAIGWNLYMLTWSNQSPVPVEGVLLGSRVITDASTYAADGWIAHTPLIEGQEETMALPNAGNRINSTEPPRASNGLVAGDRLILVGDRTNPAVIRWSSNKQGRYTNFSPAAGGGYKTLTSGNLYLPASVKLWQNPQSVDTITILCVGVDGYSTAYYMSPADVQSGSGTVAIMGFEETTATPGTVSPFGNEVLNNALHHPLDVGLMKSMANNYNISHKMLSDNINNKWIELLDKEKIVSTQVENRLFYIVNNPDGVPVPEHCNGNEIWVYNAGTDTGTWSRWLIPAVSLRKIEVNEKLYLAVVLPHTIAILDELSYLDTVPDELGNTQELPIPWYLETNTQGANRAHDAPVHLKQIGVNLGNVLGTVRWGIVGGWTFDGKRADFSKVYRNLDEIDLHARPMPWDREDFLQVARQMKEWRFFIGSESDDLYSYGKINAVQYRYVPISVNVQTEFGSTETFEYERATMNWGQRTTDGGIPKPMLDTRYP